MAQDSTPATYGRLMEEVNQGHSVRKGLYQALESELGQNRKVIAFFTSPVFPVMIEDQDADMLEEVLHNSRMNGTTELILILNSPGGDALSAERIVNICRNFGNGNFSVIIPKMAKSAATMICLGASKICMGKTSELGPIDPQIPVEDEKGHATRHLAAHEIIESYQELIEKANKTKGRLEPFLQQLARFDARDIRKIRSAQQLSESIAITCLQNCVFKGLSSSKIKAKIKPFLDPRQTKVHGRPIYYDLAQKCGLNVEVYELNSPIWQLVWQLYIRLNHVVSNSIGKIIESSDSSFTAPVPPFSVENMGEE